jgi:DNA polymerase-1
VADDILAEAKTKIVDLMQHATKLNVPLLVQAGVGPNWDEAH